MACWALLAMQGVCVEGGSGWCRLTGCAGGVLLDGSSLLDELVLLGGGETALDGRADGGRTELGSQARGRAEDLSLENHGGPCELLGSRKIGFGGESCSSSRGCRLRLFWYGQSRRGGMRSEAQIAWLGYSSAKSGMNQAICHTKRVTWVGTYRDVTCYYATSKSSSHMISGQFGDAARTYLATCQAEYLPRNCAEHLKSAQSNPAYGSKVVSEH